MFFIETTEYRVKANMIKMSGIFAHPIFSREGDYPKIVRERVDCNSKREGWSSSRLPTFTQEEIEEIK
ncbi:hypothetical protein J6590_107650, partial [Homalodisca vitripennis]